MTTVESRSDIQKNLGDLRGQVLKGAILFAIVPSFLWLILVVWPVTGRTAPIEVWIGSIVLTLSIMGSFWLQERHLRVASGLLVGGITLAVTCAVIAFESPQIGHLYTVAVAFASVLLGPVGIAITVAVTLPLTIGISTYGLGLAPVSTSVLLPPSVVIIMAAAFWLSERNLYTALAWSWAGYERAQHNEQTARERAAQLRQALKALDEATYRLERTNHMLALAREQADEARRIKQRFAQTVSHELRTPINLIVGFTALMVQSPEYYEEPLPSAYVRDLSIVHRNACHLQDLVNDVLDLARIEAAQMSLVLEETDPAVLVTEAVNTARSLVESRGLALHTDIAPDLPTLRVDPTRIRQVLFNLLNNAVRFTERGSVTVGVCLRRGEVRFRVTDTGVGIAAQDVPRLFQEFGQLDSSTRRRHEGAGLGLAISRDFVELHGGRIWAESQVGKGSTFTFAIPVQHPEMMLARRRQPTGRARVRPTGPNRECVFLAVTRSLSAAGLLTRYLRGARVVVTNTLEHAREVARQLLPQAVLVDSASLAPGGVPLEALVEEWGMPGIPFLFCPLPGEEPLRRRLSVDGYLIKPISREDLWDVLRQFGGAVDKVLVIDDDRDFVRLMARLLDNPVRRYEVGSAYSAHEGLEMLHRWGPDLLLLDLGLPDMDGLQLMERIRSDPRLRETPIVIVSARDETEELQVLAGHLTIAKTTGFAPNEVVRWIQSAIDAVVQTPNSRPAGETDDAARLLDSAKPLRFRQA